MALLTPPAAAVLVQTNEQDTTSETAYPASATDLINQGQPTFLSQDVADYTPFNFNGTSSTDALNDGSTGSAGSLNGATFDIDGTWVSTFNLDTSVNTLGYDITSIQTIAGWIENRTNQRYDVSYSLAGSPGFQPLGSFGYFPPDDPDANSTRITLTDSGGGTIAGLTGVDAIQFAFRTPGQDGNDETVYREVDVFGSPTVPEPASLALLGLGGLGLLARRRA